jgi:uncharacterized protein (DUF2062 family)
MAYFRDKFRSIFSVKDTPRRISLAFAMGVFMGVSPFLGLHYILAFCIAWLFRLNKLVTIVGVSVNNPWTIVPISTFCAWFGAKILGIKHMLPTVDWNSVTLSNIISKMTDLHNFIDLVNKLMPLIKAFVVGSLIACTVSAVVSYFIIHVLITRYKKAKDAA